MTYKEYKEMCAWIENLKNKHILVFQIIENSIVKNLYIYMGDRDFITRG